jgi:hypothetical protein
MPRQSQTLSIEQINEFLELTANEPNETIQAVRLFLKAELNRRNYAGNTGGRPQTVADKRQANREYQRKWRAKQRPDK